MSDLAYEPPDENDGLAILTPVDVFELCRLSPELLAEFTLTVFPPGSGVTPRPNGVIVPND